MNEKQRRVLAAYMEIHRQPDGSYTWTLEEAEAIRAHFDALANWVEGQ